LGNKFPALFEVANYSNELFELADINKDGSLDAEEFKTVLRSIDHRLTRLPTTATGTSFTQFIYYSLSHCHIVSERMKSDHC
jgi:hypothetical protein